MTNSTGSVVDRKELNINPLMPPKKKREYPSCGISRGMISFTDDNPNTEVYWLDSDETLVKGIDYVVHGFGLGQYEYRIFSKPSEFRLWSK